MKFKEEEHIWYFSAEQIRKAGGFGEVLAELVRLSGWPLTCFMRRAPTSGPAGYFDVFESQGVFSYNVIAYKKHES